ncbi:conditioned medium-induced protein 4 [Halapricum hydrolyticum]|uniref:Conditioned medium-induced protein 4 n=1 Tax=Halapricum hydrolyticum TaxID=2979991 RepID=A0AAE3IAQ7_9EURY|nr:conditioned medium-induced protein 4 [Halapricum hydrolyticum]MCU4717522.1 conditioned medium-induced protein 4 [Halapricum hydrolyticum]MCU4726686.1 conditioned medium-induced protein 4 [Halapricum hydrolyticum]
MDEKTEQLRDIFVDVAGEETVTERQQEGRGSLADSDDERIVERLIDVIEDMRERYDFETDCDDRTLAAIVRGFYEGDDDGTLADELDLDVETVFRARMDLHLVEDSDADAPFSMASLRDLLAEDADSETIAAELDADRDAIEHFGRVATAQNRARRTSHRYRTAFEEILTDADLSIQLTESVKEDGLDDATEDIETDLSF